MDTSFDQFKSCHSSRSILTNETYDTTNNTSTSSGISLDMDVHGSVQRSRHNDQLNCRSDHPNIKMMVGEFEKENHIRCGGDSYGESYNTFGESFMMEDSFANGGESFSTGYYDSNRNNNNNERYQHQQRHAPSRFTDDFSSILIIEEEECEDNYAQHELGDTGNVASFQEKDIRLGFKAPNVFNEVSYRSTQG